MEKNKNYVLITAAKNEEKTIERTIRSVDDQSVLPLRWIIVDDGSTDRTSEILKHYAKHLRYLNVISKRGELKANFESQVRAINTGIEQLAGLKYDFIGNLDADITFDPDYYQKIIEKFSEDRNLGLAGGAIYEEQKGSFTPRNFNSENSVAHAVHFYLRECFESVEGYIPLPYGGSDTVAETTARMKGWKVKTFFEIPVRHHRMTCGVEGIVRGGYRQGKMDYTIGNTLFFELIKCISRWKVRPLLMYSAARMLGFMSANLKSEKKKLPDEFISYLRKEQKLRIKQTFLFLSGTNNILTK